MIGPKQAYRRMWEPSERGEATFLVHFSQGFEIIEPHPQSRSSNYKDYWLNNQDLMARQYDYHYHWKMDSMVSFPVHAVSHQAPSTNRASGMALDCEVFAYLAITYY